MYFHLKNTMMTVMIIIIIFTVVCCIQPYNNNPNKILSSQSNYQHYRLWLEIEATPFFEEYKRENVCHWE